MKIAILVREETALKCTGRGCLKAFQQRKDAFSRYKDEDELELLAFTHVGGDLDHKIKKMLKNGVETVHLSTCLRSKSPDYEELINRLSEHFNVVGYTHGPESPS